MTFPARTNRAILVTLALGLLVAPLAADAQVAGCHRPENGGWESRTPPGACRTSDVSVDGAGEDGVVSPLPR